VADTRDFLTDVSANFVPPHTQPDGSLRRQAARSPVRAKSALNPPGVS
jgi:hypothetical protein